MVRVGFVAALGQLNSALSALVPRLVRCSTHDSTHDTYSKAVLGFLARGDSDTKYLASLASTSADRLSQANASRSPILGVGLFTCRAEA